MPEQKTKPTTLSFQEYVSALKTAEKQADAKALASLMTKISGFTPVMWGSIVGFGRYEYTYDSGHSGYSMVLGFAMRASSIVVYIVPGFDDAASELEKLGKHTHAKSCLYIKKLSDINTSVLEDIVKKSFEYMKKKYPSLKAQ
jgi:hypothetical protein